MNPLVSIIMPVYNTEKYLSAAIKSVIDQTYVNWELIIVNDESPGDTRHVVKMFTDSRIKYIEQSNSGPAATRNTGMYSSNGDFIAFLDSDDIWHNNKLEKQISIFTHKPDIGVVYSQRETIDEDGNTITGYLPKLYNGMVLNKLWVDNFVCNSSAIISRKIFNKIGGMNKNLRMSEDWEYWLRIACYFKFDYVDEPLVKYRVHDEQVSKKIDLRINVCADIRNNFIKEHGHLLTYSTKRKARSYQAFNRALRTVGLKPKQAVIIDCLKALAIYPFMTYSWKNFVRILILSHPCNNK